MTRWARAGSTQKHRKMPEDSTPWEEFVSQRKTITKTEKKFLGNKIKKLSNEVAQTSLKKKLKQRFKKAKMQGKPHDSSLLIENDYNDMSSRLDPVQNECDSHGDRLDSSEEHRTSEIHSKKNKKRNLLEFLPKGEVVEAVLKGKMLNAVRTFVQSDSENLNTSQANLLLPHKNKKHKSGKKMCTKSLSDAVFENEDKELITDSENEEESKIQASGASYKAEESTESSPGSPKHHVVQRKNKSFFEKVKEARAHNGILLLPKDVENRLYRMKKSLRGKGFSGEDIKRMVREARRKAELKYRKTMKTCFNCREFGHVLANCPKMVEDNEQGTGICFKCGSTEHVSYKCHIKKSDFPFAKCFVCHNTGHISRNCPENKHGVYPKGGQCNLCGSIYHLRKDCPKSFKKGDEEAEITAHTINEFRSADDEVHEMEPKPIKQKKPKVVKF